MKIAMLCSRPFPPREGEGIYIHNLSRELIKRGHEVIIITRGGLGEKVLKYEKLVVFELPFLMAYPFHVDIHGIFVKGFLRHLQSIDILHIHTPLPPSISNREKIGGIVSTFHTTLYGASYRTEVVDFRSALGRILGLLSKRIERSIIKSSGQLTVSSRSVALELVRYYDVDFSDIRILGNGVDQIFLEKNSSSKDREQEALLCVGRLGYGKGLYDLMESMRIVVSKRPGSKLVLVGEGPLSGTLKHTANELGLRNNVEFRGFISLDELLLQYLRSSVFVMPSYYEGMPTVILEAMASGLPVVATRVPGNVDVIKDGVTGILVPPKEPRKLAHAMLELLDHPEMRHDLGRRAREYVREDFTWDKVTDRTLTAYNDALG